MKPLYTEEEFKKAKSSDKLNLECECCNNIIVKEKRVINYGIRGYEGRQNDYCSDCFYEKKTKYIELKCSCCGKSFVDKLSKTNRKKLSINVFCSKRCSISYLNDIYNKDIRKDINKKISNTLKTKPIKTDSGKECSGCKVLFCSVSGYNKYCSDECVKLLFKTTEHRNKMSKALKGKAGGLRDGGGYSRQYEYINIHGMKMKLNRSEIEVAKSLDNLNLDWIRNTKGFHYKTVEGEDRKYYPDFYVKDYDIYVEYKGFVTEKMKHKMSEAERMNGFKLLIIYSNDKRYRNLGLNISQVKENNNTIIDNIKNIIS
jgi:hypothetical protein